MRFYTSVEHPGGDIIFVRGWDTSKGRFQEKVKFNPTVFVSSKKETEWTTLTGDYVNSIQPGSISETKEFIEKYKNVEGIDIYGFDRWKHQYIAEAYPGEIKYDVTKISQWTLDIETTAKYGFPRVDNPEEEVILITLQNYNTKQIISFGWHDYTPSQENVNYIHCKNEYQLLSSFISWWSEFYPDVVTGWNLIQFDIPYLCARIERVLGEKEMKKLSPWKRVSRSTSHNKFGQEFIEYNLTGINVLDYLEIFRSPVFNAERHESYRLDYVANVILGVGKLDNPYDTFQQFIDNDPDRFVDYNIRDVELVDRLEDELALLNLIYLMAYDSHACYDDCQYQVRLWDIIVYNHLLNQKKVVPLLTREDKAEKFDGAYVKEPTPGSYKYVVSYDMTALYPSIIRMLNISPETLMDKRHPSVNIHKLVNKEVDMSEYKDFAVAANGALYRIEVYGMMPYLVTKVFKERKEYKNKMLECKKRYEKNPTPELKKEVTKWDNWQKVRKVCANSLYGALGNAYFRHYKLANAEAVTTTGQVVIKWAEKKFNDYLNKICGTENEDYVIAVDTDSNYLNLEPIFKKVFGNEIPPAEKMVDIMDRFCEEKLSPYIESCHKELAEYLNCYENTLNQKRECIADKAIWTAKKRYIMNVWDSEGVRYKEPKLKIMGIECVRSSTPKVVRKYIEDALKLIMNKTEDDLIEFIEVKRNEFNRLPVEDIAAPRTVNNIDKFKDHTTLYKKATPIHVRASILHNYLIETKHLDKKYTPLNNGDKMKFVFLKTPNPIRENVIGFINEFPPEFGLTNWVDRDIMFEKNFLDPMKVILDTIGWNTEKKISIEDFFS
jgi:DNA polymerase elongation subunit (family B)